MIEKIISGGQTGADQGGIIGAKAAGIPTGGCAPKGWRTDAGPAPWLAYFGLVEADSHKYEYRTFLNVQEAHGTVIFGDIHSAGSKLTIRYCEQERRPYLINPSSEELEEWTRMSDIWVLNVAGNRASRQPMIMGQVALTVFRAFS